MDFRWLRIQICICWSQITLKKVGVKIRRPVGIWCDHHLSPAARHISFPYWSGCWLWPVKCCPTPLQWLCEVLEGGGNWNTLSYMSIQTIPNILNGWHVWWVCRPWKNWDIFSFQELYTDPCDMGPCIIMLKHEVIAADEWHDNGPQDLCPYKLPLIKWNCVCCP